MNLNDVSGRMTAPCLCRRSRNERGQILPLMAVMMVTFFCMCGFVIDTGRLYVSYTQLQASTEAAALAGAQSLPSGPNAVAAATAYSSVSGDANAYANLPGVSIVSANTKAECLTSLKNQGLACSTATGTYNAIQVQQIATVPMSFANFFGQKSLTIGAVATAAAKGSNPVPYNIAIIIDTTASMGSGSSDTCTDPNPPGKTYTTRIQCALVGVKALLLKAAPCSANYTTCPSGGTDAVDMISLFTFPNAVANTASKDYTKPCGGPTTASSYAFPTPGATTYSVTGTGATYQITPFLNDFRTGPAVTTLNPSSELTLALGQVSGCTGMTAPGGLGTYFAGAVIAAQAALLEEQAQTGRSNSLNSIVLLSDGAANSTQMATTYVNSSGSTVTVSKTASTYPSTINQCQQGMNAASLATNLANNPTVVYTVAYGASASSGCTTDTSGTNKNIAPCAALEAMASAPADFFSDYTAKGGDSGCTSALQPATGLAAIFDQIYYNTTKARLIPNGTT
jgi:hypothetical protein